MKNTIIYMLITAFIFTGCVNTGLEVSNDLDTKTEVYKRFQDGKVLAVEKILIDESKTAILTGFTAGAVVGAGTGAVATKSGTGAGFGALIGGAVGALAATFRENEVEAYETHIEGAEGVVTAYLLKKLPLNTEVEYIQRKNSITNVNVISIQTTTGVITKRYYKNESWYYVINGITLSAPKKYMYLNDLAEVKFDEENQVVDMKLLKSNSGVRRTFKPKKEVVVPKKVSRPKQITASVPVAQTAESQKSFW